MEFTDVLFVLFYLGIAWSLLNGSDGGGKRSRMLTRA